MLGNLKDFISVVQDGLSTNSNLRQTLQEVQKVKNIFHREKQKSVSESKVDFGAGGALLEKYQDNWAELHKNADNNAKAAEAVDKAILDLHFAANARLQHASDLAQNLACLPNLTASVAQCIDSLKIIQEMINVVEDDLVDLDDVVERHNMEKWKLDHHYHLSLYKEKKLAALEETRCQLAKQNAELHLEREKQQLAELQTRRETSANAFQSDLAMYLATGNVPVVPSTPPDITLEQVELDEDKTDLEKFLENTS